VQQLAVAEVQVHEDKELQQLEQAITPPPRRIHELYNADLRTSKDSSSRLVLS
jgi:hypothetical protein